MDIETLKQLPISHHLKTDHSRRWNIIQNEVGYGTKVLMEKEDSRDGKHILTDSGILFVTNRNSTYIITAYVPAIPKIFKMSQRGDINITPKELNKVLDKIIYNKEHYKEFEHGYQL